MYKLCVLIVITLVAGCGTRSTLAPVVELGWQPQNTQQTSHIVRRGETLYAVAFRYDLDYKQLAALNHLSSPYSLRVGQVLQVRAQARTGTAGQFVAKPEAIPRYFSPRRTGPQHEASLRTLALRSRHGQWLWPVSGRIAAQFDPKQGKKGIDIAGRKGEKIRAAAAGVVAYAGSGLSGYGNLIIIKHNAQYLTAYGNNLRNSVKEGQKVKVGQIIAEIGVIDRHYWGVHFEIRKNGKPVNPLDYLRKS